MNSFASIHKCIIILEAKHAVIIPAREGGKVLFWLGRLKQYKNQIQKWKLPYLLKKGSHFNILSLIPTKSFIYIYQTLAAIIFIFYQPFNS